MNKKMGHLIGIGMLTLAAVIWGFAFTAQKQLMDHMGPITCNCLRFLVGASFLFLLVVCRGVLLRKGAEGRSFPVFHARNGEAGSPAGSSFLPPASCSRSG